VDDPYETPTVQRASQSQLHLQKRIDKMNLNMPILASKKNGLGDLHLPVSRPGRESAFHRKSLEQFHSFAGARNGSIDEQDQGSVEA